MIKIGDRMKMIDFDGFIDYLGKDMKRKSWNFNVRIISELPEDENNVKKRMSIFIVFIFVFYHIKKFFQMN